MNSRRVVVVTGSNKGIGYAVVKELCKKYDGDIYLTARDPGRGQQAVEKLKTLGYNPIFHQLDVSDQDSVDTFRDHLKTKHGGLDILINNAAVLFDIDCKEPLSVQAEETIRVNYYGTLRMCEALFPLLRLNGRVINVSSDAGHLSQIPSSTLRKKFADKNITVSEVNKLMDKFVHDAKQGKHEKEGWGGYIVPYYVSKVGITCVSFIHQRLFDAEVPNRNISVNAVHPGYIDTDMTKEMKTYSPGTRPVEEGTKAILFLALQADLKGKYVWWDCEVVDWVVPSEKLQHF